MFRIDASSFLREVSRIESAVRVVAKQALGQAASYAAELARRTTKFKDRTTRLRSSIDRKQRGAYEYDVTAGGRRAGYAWVVESGSKAHEIRPKRTGTVSSRRAAGKKMPPMLRFQIAGRWVSAKLVKHPGTHATHFMLDARNAAEHQLLRFVETGLSGSLR